MGKSNEKFQLDNHKLIYHPTRVTKFLNEGDCYPIYMEISPVGACNHRCVFCAYDFIGYPNRKLEKERTLKFIEEIAEAGVKSVLYAGEGEPLLHPNIDEFIAASKNNGIDVGMFSNGQLLKESLSEKILPYLTFLRFSFNGGNEATYSNIHKVKEKVFDTVVQNISKSANIKKQNNLSVDLGAQFVLLPENIDSLFKATQTIKNAGLDYFVVKPFVQQNAQQGYQIKERFNELELIEIEKELSTYKTENFDVQLRVNDFLNYGKREYSNCLGTSFITAINSAGQIASCLPYWEKEEFIYGNIFENSFAEIWNGEKRKSIKHFLENKCDVGNCPPNCRPNSINNYLWKLKNPAVKHINFI